jgi:hypothetical protein
LARADAGQDSRSIVAISLTNADIVKMAKAGLSADIILAKIKGSPCRFDTSPDALTKLKEEGVPQTVILAMIESPNADHSTPQATEVLPSTEPRAKEATQAAVASHTDTPTVFVRGANAMANRIRKKERQLGCYVQVDDPAQADFFLDINIEGAAAGAMGTVWTTQTASVVLSDKSGKVVWSGSSAFHNQLKKMVKETCK